MAVVFGAWGVVALSYHIALSYQRVGEVIIRQTLNIDLPLVYHIQSLLRAWAHFKLVNSAM